jgi:hypothetical protein
MSTDRVCGLTVVLQSDMDVEAADEICQVINLLRGVARVDLHVVDSAVDLARCQERIRISKELGRFAETLYEE